MGDRIRVLHVDDEPDGARMIAEWLTDRHPDFEVDTTSTIDDAVARLATRRYDCIVSGYEVSGKDGRSFLHTVRERYPEVPFILFTGNGSEEVASEAISAGVTDHLQKGAKDTYEVFVQRIRNACAASGDRGFEALVTPEPLQLLDRLSDAIFGLDTEWRFTYLNDPAAEIYGRPADELLGHSIWDLFPDARETPFFAAYHRAVETREAETVEACFEPWDTWYREHIYPTADN